MPGTIQFPSLSATPSPPPVDSYLLYVRSDNTVNLEDSFGNVYTFGSTTAITSLTGDVTATGPGAAAATIEAIQGNSVLGTTGTGDVVFSASPTLTGTLNGASAIFSSTISASNFSGSSTGTNTGDVTVINTNSIDLAFSSGQTGLSANLNLSSSGPDAGYIPVVSEIKSDGLLTEVLAGVPVNIGTSNSVGSAASAARSDHVHAITSSVALGLELTGYTTGTSTPVTATDTVLEAFENLQAQISYSPPVENQVVVQLNPGPGQFSSISAAVASITTASASSPWTVTVGPGVYTEPQIILKPYISILGKPNAVTVVASNPSEHLILAASNSTIQNLELTGVTGSGYAAVYNNGSAFYMLSCACISNNIGLWCDGTTTSSLTFVTTTVFDDSATNAVLITNNGNPSTVLCEAIIISSATAVSTFEIHGSGCILTISATALMGSGTNVGFNVFNGALLEIVGCALSNYGTGLSVPNTGTAPQVIINGTSFFNNNNDINVAHISATGTIQATAAESKITFATPGNFALLLLDPDGEIIESGVTKTEQANGVFTDTTTLAIQSTPMGVLDGGVITIVSGLTVNVSAGYGYLDTNGSSTTPAPGSILRINWNSTNISLSALTNNYLYFNSSAVLTANSNFPDTAGNILLGRVVTNSTGVEFIDASPVFIHHAINEDDNFFREAIGPVFSYGCQVTEDATPLHLDVTQGSYFFSKTNFLPSAGTNITFQTFYQNGGGGWVIGSTNTVDTNNYDNGSGTLQPIPANYYARHTLYLVGQGSNQQYLFVYAQTTYPTLVLAQTGNIPSPPSYFDDGVVLLASIIVKQGSTSIISGGGQIVDNRPRIGFSTPAVEAVGTVTSVGTGSGLTGGPITSSGTISLAEIAGPGFLANSSNSFAVPIATTLTSMLDAVLGANQGAVIYRAALNWVELLPGSSGQFLQTAGASANPLWASVLPTLLTGYTTGTNTPISATNSILTAFENLQAQISATVGSAITSLTGDVTATGPGPAVATVTAFQGHSVSTTAPTDSQVLIWNSGTAKWTPESLSGDINITNLGVATIQSNVVSNSKLAQAPADTLKGNNTGSTANVADLTVSQVNTMLGTVTIIGTYDGNGSATNGLSISGNDLYAQSATVSNPGMVNTTTQSFAGNKTFIGTVAITPSSVSALTVNTSSFIFDSVNNAFGIGLQPSTSVMIDGLNTTGASKLVQMTGYGVGSTTGYRGRFARGTLGSPSAVQSGDILSAISGRGYGVSQFASASTGVINIVAGETFTNTSNLTYLQFSTTPTGSVTSTESMRVASSGVTLGPQSSSTAVHQINGGLSGTTNTITSATYILDSVTTDYIVYTNSTSTAITLTLPAPTNGRILVIEDKAGTAGTNNITVNPHSSETINGKSSFVISQNYGSIRITSDGTNWFIQALPPNVASTITPVVALTESGGTTTINWATGNMFTLTLNANLTISFSNTTAGQTIVIRLTNTTSNYTVAWPSIRWPVATVPIMSTGAVSDVYTILYDGTAFYGSYVQNMS
jgi:hypothetical protein